MRSNLSVIICAYTEKRWSELSAAIESVQRQTLLPKEIIVVSDHNSALFQRVQQTFVEVKCIENYNHKGLSGARNSGWTTAEGEIVAFLDDDAVAQPDWLEHMVSGYVHNSQIMGIGGKIVPYWESGYPGWFPEEFNWVVGCTYRGFPRHNMPVRNMIGANMSMRRTILAAEGGFRESFGCDKNTGTGRGTGKWFNHYAGDEETEFCIRASSHLPGNIWLYVASAVVHHRVSVDRTRFGYFLWRCYDEGLGKASLARLHHSSQALSSEKTYTFKTLPRGIARGMDDAVRKRDLDGLRRSGTIVIGLFATTIGYLIGSISTRIARLQDAKMNVSKSSISHSVD